MNGTLRAGHARDCKTEFVPGKLMEHLARAAFPEKESMRDRFAMAALEIAWSSEKTEFDNAREAYRIADHLMEARK